MIITYINIVLYDKSQGKKTPPLLMIRFCLSVDDEVFTEILNLKTILLTH